MKFNEVMTAAINGKDVRMPYKDFARLVNAANKADSAAGILAVVHSSVISEEEKAILECVRENETVKSRIMEEISAALDDAVSPVLDMLDNTDTATDETLSASDADVAKHTMSVFMNDSKIH